MVQFKVYVNKIPLTDESMKNLKILKTYKYAFSVTSSLTWSDSGEILLACCGNNTLSVQNLRTSSSNKTLYSKTSGVNAVRFIDKENSIIACSCESENNADHKNFVRYWDITENKYLKSLPQIGTVCSVNGISISPNKKLMLINTDDGHVKLYYVNTNADNPLVLYKSDFERPVSTFDNEGEIFIATFGKSAIHIYETAMYSKGESSIFNLEKMLKKNEYITNLLFTPSNQYIIVSTNENSHFKIDSITGEYICSYENKMDPSIKKSITNPHNISDKKFFCDMKQQNEKGNLGDYINKIDKKYFNYDINLTPYLKFSNTKKESFTNHFFFPTVTPDEKYVIIGGNDAGVHIWKEDGTYLTALFGHMGPPYTVAFNPQYAILGSSHLNIIMWQPDD